MAMPAPTPRTSALWSTFNILGKPPCEPPLEQDFEVQQQIGKGAFGVVRLGHRRYDGAQLAVKSIAKSKLTSKEDVMDVQSEVAIMNLVAGHSNVVTLQGTYEDHENVHIVMELCGGGELFDSIVQSGSFSERKAAHVFKKMVEVPENFLLTAKGPDAELKLTDFGLGIFFKHGEKMKDLVGSPYYVAPEVLRHGYSHEADIWSLGVILYILLSGLPPFWGDNEQQIFNMVLKGTVDFSIAPWPSISDAAKDCVLQMIQRDVSKRASAAQILTHDWLRKEGVALDAQLDSVVLHRIKHFAQMNKLKKVCLMVIGQQLSPDEITGLKALFRSIDTDDSGTITVDELRHAIDVWGHKHSTIDLSELMSVADVDGDGMIDYNEFVAATMHISKLDKEDLLQRAFQQFDSDGSGSISLDELAVALRRFGVYDDAKSLLDGADIDGDGQIDYAEFSALLRAQQAGPEGTRSRRQLKSYL